MNYLASNIKFLRKKNKIGQDKLAYLLDRSQPTIQQWEAGNRTPNMETTQKIANLFKIDIDQLVTTDLTVGIKNKTGELSKSNAIKIPVLGEIPCGTPIEAIENIIDYEEITEVMARSGNYFGLVAKGTSMFPKIEEGDILIVKQTTHVESGQIAIVKVNGDEATCKKVVLNDYGITLMPINTSHNPVMYTKEEIETLPIMICGRVIEIRRTL